MTSASVAALLQRHRANRDLNAASIPAAARSAQDLAADAPARPLDERIIETAGAALDAGHTHYEPVPGIDPLRAALAQHLAAATGHNWQADNLLVTAGMQEARFLTLQLLDAQDGPLALPEVVHPGVRKALGVRPRATRALAVDDARRLPQPAAIRAALEDGCRLLYLESPSRLSGAACSAQELADLTALLEQYGASLMLDRGLAPWLAAEPTVAAAGRVALLGEAGGDEEVADRAANRGLGAVLAVAVEQLLRGVAQLGIIGADRHRRRRFGSLGGAAAALAGQLARCLRDRVALPIERVLDVLADRPIVVGRFGFEQRIGHLQQLADQLGTRADQLAGQAGQLRFLHLARRVPRGRNGAAVHPIVFGVMNQQAADPAVHRAAVRRGKAQVAVLHRQQRAHGFGQLLEQLQREPAGF